jgi:DNA-binding FadR family transcriptional regulator
MGLIEVRHGSGVYVARSTHQFIASSFHALFQIERVGILDVVELRRVLAQYSVGLAVHRATDDDLEQIERHDEALTSAAYENDPSKIIDAALAFHAAVSSAAHDPLLLALESVISEVLTTLQVMAFPDRTPDFWGEWNLELSDLRKRLITALRERDKKRSVAARLEYLDGLKARILVVPEFAALRISDPEATRILVGRSRGAGATIDGTS